MKNDRLFGVVYCGYVGYETIKNADVLPANRAWCKNCAKESSKPVAYVNFNGKVGILLSCECGEKYVMYYNEYKTRYIGFESPKLGFIAPSSKGGATPYQISTLRKNTENYMINTYMEVFGYSEEEARQYHIGMERQILELRKDIDGRSTERINNVNEKNAIVEANTKSQMIKDGILIYDKKRRCLVNKNTGEVLYI